MSDVSLSDTQGLSSTSVIEATVVAAVSVSVNGVSSALEVLSYASQDQGAVANIEDDGDSLRITGNGWKKVAFDSAVTVTPYTVLSFDFQSSTEGEFHGIGLANSDDVFDGDTHLFKLYGTDEFSISDNTTAGDYSGSAPGVKHYEIALGELFTGAFSFLTFVNDHDRGAMDAVSVFSNVALYETSLKVSVDGVVSDLEVMSYAGQDQGATQSIEDDRSALRISGNGWKRVQFDTAVTVTSNTVLSFDFQGVAEGEFHGIGLANSNNVFDGDTWLFKLYGTDEFSISDNASFSDYSAASPGVKHYEIALGDYFTGSFDFLTFVNDHDRGAMDAESVFSNIEIYEQPLDVSVNGVLSSLSIQSYSIQDQGATIKVEDGGAKLHIEGNGWKKVVFDTPLTVTPHTVLSFDFQSMTEGEFHGIGLANSNDVFDSGSHLFKLYGTDEFTISDNTSFADYASSAPGVKHYEIELGDYMSGEFSYLTFVNDHDGGEMNGEGVFSNIELYERPTIAVTTNINSNDLGIESYAGQDHESEVSIEDSGSSLHITGNGWKKVAFDTPLVVTPDTVLSFDFQSDTEGEFHGIGLTNSDNVFDGDSPLFKLFGTDSFSIGDNTSFADYATSAPGVKHYEIPLGDYATGTYGYLTFVNDHDRGMKNAESVFSNIAVIESGGELIDDFEYEWAGDSDLCLLCGRPTFTSYYYPPGHWPFYIGTFDASSLWSSTGPATNGGIDIADEDGVPLSPFTVTREIPPSLKEISRTGSFPDDQTGRYNLSWLVVDGAVPAFGHAVYELSDEVTLAAYSTTSIEMRSNNDSTTTQVRLTVSDGDTTYQSIVPHILTDEFQDLGFGMTTGDMELLEGSGSLADVLSSPKAIGFRFESPEGGYAEAVIFDDLRVGLGP